MRTVKRIFTVSLSLLALSAGAVAAENAVLRNGFAIQHEHRRVDGEKTRLFLTAGEESFVDLATKDIEKYERVEAASTVHSDAVAHPIAQRARDKGGATVNATAVKASTKLDLKALVKDASAKTQIDEDFIHSVIQAESAAKARAVSPKGARGLMQLMPATARELGVKDAFDAEQNIDGGTRYLKALLERYNGDAVKALAAYNAGASRVDRYKGVPPYRETRAYVAKIIRDFNRKKKAAGD
jgi:soluble lytic murein transglycosylase-like protein